MLKLLAIQHEIAWEDKPATLARIDRLLEGTAPAAGSLIVLPEMFSTGFTMHVDAAAEDAAGPAHAWLRGIAQRYSTCVVGGVVTVSASGRGHNEAVAYGPDGSELARYRKNHLFVPAGEERFYDPGHQVALFQWQGIHICPVICYDLRFPELFREAVRQGAEAFLVIANWPAARALHWRTLLAARAIENQAYVVGVNRTGRDPHCLYAGDSRVISPLGVELAVAGDGGQCLAAQLDPEAVRTLRREFPVLAGIAPSISDARANRASPPPGAPADR